MNTRKSVLIVSAVLLTVLALGQTAWATCGVITPNPLLPADVGAYETAADVHASYTGLGLTIVLQDIIHQPLANTTIRQNFGPDEVETFNSSLSGNAQVNGSPVFPVLGTGPVSVEVFGKVGNVTGTFQTEMISMSLTANTTMGPLMIRESPLLHSTGQTIITDIGEGLYHIESFFDVFTELSVDGGMTWIPSDGSTRVDLCPEPVSLMLLALGGLTVLRRKRR